MEKTTCSAGGLLLRLFGACCGNTCECDWGVQRVNYYNSYWSYAIYDFSFKTTYAWFHYYDDYDVLTVVTHNYYDNGNYLETRDYYNKYANYGDVD